MSDEQDTGSLFASPQSMGASGSLPIPEVGAEEGEFESTEISGDYLPEDDLDDDDDEDDDDDYDALDGLDEEE